MNKIKNLFIYSLLYVSLFFDSSVNQAKEYISNKMPIVSIRYSSFGQLWAYRVSDDIANPKSKMQPINMLFTFGFGRLIDPATSAYCDVIHIVFFCLFITIGRKLSPTSQLEKNDIQ